MVFSPFDGRSRKFAGASVFSSPAGFPPPASPPVSPAEFLSTKWHRRGFPFLPFPPVFNYRASDRSPPGLIWCVRARLSPPYGSHTEPRYAFLLLTRCKRGLMLLFFSRARVHSSFRFFLPAPKFFVLPRLWCPFLELSVMSATPPGPRAVTLELSLPTSPSSCDVSLPPPGLPSFTMGLRHEHWSLS